MISLDFSAIQLKLKEEEGKTRIFDPVRKKWLILTTEEHVRQYIIAYLYDILKYPLALMTVERKIQVEKTDKRFDIVVFDRTHNPWMLIECKAPEVVISETTLNQLLQYHNTLQCKYLVLTNGHQTFCAFINEKKGIEWTEQLPFYDL